MPNYVNSANLYTGAAEAGRSLADSLSEKLIQLPALRYKLMADQAAAQQEQQNEQQRLSISQGGLDEEKRYHDLLVQGRGQVARAKAGAQTQTDLQKAQVERNKASKAQKDAALKSSEQRERERHNRVLEARAAGGAKTAPSMTPQEVGERAALNSLNRQGATPADAIATGNRMGEWATTNQIPGAVTQPAVPTVPPGPASGAPITQPKLGASSGGVRVRNKQTGQTFIYRGNAADVQNDPHFDIVQ